MRGDTYSVAPGPLSASLIDGSQRSQMTQRADESVGSCADVRARPGFGGAPEQRKGVFRNDRPRRAFNQDRRVLNGSQFGAVGKLESAGEDTVRHDGSKAER